MKQRRYLISRKNVIYPNPSKTRLKIALESSLLAASITAIEIIATYVKVALDEFRNEINIGPLAKDQYFLVLKIITADIIEKMLIE